MKERAFIFAFLLIYMLLISTQNALAQFTEFNAFKEPSTSSGGTNVISGPDLKATMDKFEGGRITIGATAYVVATFKNNGTSPVKVTGINLYPSSTVSAAVNLNKCADAPLPPDAVCAVTVTVTGLQPGAWRVEILLDHDGRSRLSAATLSGEVDSGGTRQEERIESDIEADPTDLDFGTTSGTLPLVRALVLRNRTPDKVALKEIKLEAAEQAGFSLQPDCAEILTPGASCVINVKWTPTAKGASQGVVRIQHEAKSRVTRVEIKGNFTPDSAVTATPYPDSVANMGLLIANMDKIDFGTGVNNVAAITVSLINKGSADLTFKSLSLGGSDNGVSLARGGCHAGLTLKPIEACALTINWVPSRAGSVIDDLQILHTGARGVLVLPIRGTAESAATRGSITLKQSADDNVAKALAKLEKDVEKMQSTGAPSSMPPSLPKEDIPLNTPHITPVLDGYSVTSHALTKAVINGPVGSFIVRDQEKILISGVRWVVNIVPSGVLLKSGADEILLVFDRALRPVIPLSANSTAATEASSSSTSQRQENLRGR